MTEEQQFKIFQASSNQCKIKNNGNIYFFERKRKKANVVIGTTKTVHSEKFIVVAIKNRREIKNQ